MSARTNVARSQKNTKQAKKAPSSDKSVTTKVQSAAPAQNDNRPPKTRQVDSYELYRAWDHTATLAETLLDVQHRLMALVVAFPGLGAHRDSSKALSELHRMLVLLESDALEIGGLLEGMDAAAYLKEKEGGGGA